MRAALCVLILVATTPLAIGREWTDAAGKLEGEFEDCDVIVRLPSGELLAISFFDLSEHDRTFVLDELRRKADKDGPAVLPEVAQSLEKHVATLEKQIASQAAPSEIKRTLESIRTADPAFKRLEPVVKTLLDSEKPVAVSTALAILGEFKISDVWVIEKLLSLEKEYWRGLPIPDDRGYEFHRFHAIFFDDGEYFKFMNNNVRPYRRIIGLLAGLTERDRRVKELFETRIASLQSAPEPQRRAEAALGLSGASALSAKVVPVLMSAMKNDASETVQLAAGFSLGGYGGAANGVVQSLIEELEESKANEFYLSALAESYGDSPLLRKVIKRMFEGYRANRYESNFTAHACALLRRNGQDNGWAIVELTETCAVAVQNGDQSAFETLRATLLSVGSADVRVLKFFEQQARTAPDWARVLCDTAAKQVAESIRAKK